MKLIYKKDENGEEILCSEDEVHQIMMEWEKPYMEKSIEILKPFGKVLEIGFGLGYSANKICSYEAVTEYNIIECSPIVWEKFEEFKNTQLTIRPELKINLIKGRWEDVLKITDVYDCIYFDDYILNNLNLINDRVTNFLYEVLLDHTKIGSRISFYTEINPNKLYKNIKCVDFECTEFEITIPKKCKYAKGNKMYIPILTKIGEPEKNFTDNLFKENLLKKNNKPEEFEEEIKKDQDKLISYKNLFNDIQTRSPSCSLIIIDNFYKNPYETRNFILTQEFTVRGNYPGQRTISFANEHLKSIIQKYVEPFGGKITHFPTPSPDGSDAHGIYNGSFQYTTIRDRSWIHVDEYNSWAGVLYLTPNPPVSSGTTFYKFKDGTICKRDRDILKNNEEIDRWSQDMTKWIEIDNIGNVFNRLILFNSNNYHMSRDYFGDTKENARLFQVFFFSTEY